MDQPDHVDEFRDYLGRFAAATGEHDFGEFVKYHGRLVKKLTYDEFVGRYEEFTRLKTAYDEIFERGDTINDAIIRVLRERSAELIFDAPL